MTFLNTSLLCIVGFMAVTGLTIPPVQGTYDRLNDMLNREFSFFVVVLSLL